MAQETDDLRLAALVNRVKVLEDLLKYGGVTTDLGLLQEILQRHSILLGKLTFQSGLGNILYGINDPATHSRYLDSEALAAIAGAGLYTLIDGSVAFTGVIAGILPTLSAHLATKEYVDSAIHFIADYFFNNTASSPYVGIYYKMLDTPTGEAEASFVTDPALGEGDDQALVNFATDAGIPGMVVAEAGIYTGHIHAKVDASNKRPVKLHFEIYYRDNGSETLVATSEESGFLTNSSTEYNLHAVQAADVAIAATDRLIIKWLANVDATPANNVAVTLYVEGTNASRLSVPISSEVLNQLYLRQDGTKELTGNMAVSAGVTIDGVDLSADVVLKALFDANTILVANSDDTPAALTIAASRILGRKAAGNIGALTGAEILAILSGQAGANFAWNSKKLTGLAAGASSGDAVRYDEAILNNVAGQIVAVSEKTTPVANDELLIEDSADSNNKKSVKISNLKTPLKAVLYSVHQYVFTPDAAPAAEAATGTPQGNIYVSGPSTETVKRIIVKCETAAGTAFTFTLDYDSGNEDMDSFTVDTEIDEVAVGTAKGIIVSSGFTTATIAARSLIALDITVVTGTGPKDVTITLEVWRPLQT